MKKLSNVFSILAIIFSVIALLMVIATAGGNFYNTELDSAALLVGVLSAIVTVLVGFQVINIFQINNKINDAEKKINGFTRNMEEKFDSFVSAIPDNVKNDTIGEVCYILACEESGNDESFFHLCLALKYLNEGAKNQVMITNVENKIRNFIASKSSYLREGDVVNIYMSSERKENCIHIIGKYFSNRMIAVEINGVLKKLLAIGEIRIETTQK